MNPKALLIPIAAFALSATNVSAYSTQVLTEAGLTPKQIRAFQKARTLQAKGERNKARLLLQHAAIDVRVMESIRKTMHLHKHALRESMGSAIKDNDYEAFQNAIAESPLADIITSETEFEMFAQAHALNEQGNNVKAKTIMNELGVAPGQLGNTFETFIHTNMQQQPRFAQ